MTPRARPLHLFATLALACLITTPLVAQTPEEEAAQAAVEAAVAAEAENKEPERILMRGYYDQLGGYFAGKGPVLLSSVTDVVKTNKPPLDLRRLIVRRPARSHVLEHSEEDVDALRQKANDEFGLSGTTYAGLALTRTESILYFIPSNQKNGGSMRVGTTIMGAAEPSEIRQLETMTEHDNRRFLVEHIAYRENDLIAQTAHASGSDRPDRAPVIFPLSIRTTAAHSPEDIAKAVQQAVGDDVIELTDRSQGRILSLAVDVDFEKAETLALLDQICAIASARQARCIAGSPRLSERAGQVAETAAIASPTAADAAADAIADTDDHAEATVDAAGTSNDPYDRVTHRSEYTFAELSRTIDGQSAKDPVMLLIYPDYLDKPEGKLIRATRKRDKKFNIFEAATSADDLTQAVHKLYGLKDWQPVANQLSEDRSVLYFKSYPGKTYPYGTRDNITFAPVSNEEAARITSIPIADHIRANIRIAKIFREEQRSRNTELHYYTTPIVFVLIFQSQPQAAKERLLARLKSEYEKGNTTLISDIYRDNYVVGVDTDFDPAASQKLLTAMCETAKAQGARCIAIAIDRSNREPRPLRQK